MPKLNFCLHLLLAMLPTFLGTHSRQPTLSLLTTATSPFTLQLAAATMVAVNLTPAEVRNMGLQMAGFTPERQERTCLATNLARFRSAFGVSPEAIAAVLHDLQTTQIVAARDNNLNVYYFLLSVNWCREYKTEKSMAGHYRLDEKTIRSWAFYYVSKIQALKPQKIRWPTFGDETFVASVDGVHFRIYEPRTAPSATWYSHKYHKPALAYEIAVSIWDDNLIWTFGPFPAATSDITILQKPGGLLTMVAPGQKLIGDRGYNGEPVCSVRNRFDPPDVRQFKRRVRARHENFNMRIKCFEILGGVFRHGLEKHQTAFEACCVLVQYDIENGHPLMAV
jgi:hypothetical protein